MTDEEYMSKINSYLSGKNNYTKSTSKATSTQKLTDEEYMNKVNSYLNNKQRVETTAPMQTSTSAPSITPKETIADKMNQLWVEDTPQNNNDISYKPTSVKDFVERIKNEPVVENSKKNIYTSGIMTQKDVYNNSNVLGKAKIIASNVGQKAKEIGGSLAYGVSKGLTANDAIARTLGMTQEDAARENLDLLNDLTGRTAFAEPSKGMQKAINVGNAAGGMGRFMLASAATPAGGMVLSGAINGGLDAYGNYEDAEGVARKATSGAIFGGVAQGLSNVANPYVSKALSNAGLGNNMAANVGAKAVTDFASAVAGSRASNLPLKEEDKQSWGQTLLNAGFYTGFNAFGNILKSLNISKQNKAELNRMANDTFSKADAMYKEAMLTADATQRQAKLEQLNSFLGNEKEGFYQLVANQQLLGQDKLIKSIDDMFNMAQNQMQQGARIYGNTLGETGSVGNNNSLSIIGNNITPNNSLVKLLSKGTQVANNTNIPQNLPMSTFTNAQNGPTNVLQKPSNENISNQIKTAQNGNTGATEQNTVGTVKTEPKVEEIINNKTLFHQTKANSLSEMDKSLRRAGLSDTTMPSGIFLKDTDIDIGLEGKNQLKLDTQLGNSLEVQDRNELVRILNEDEKYKDLREKALNFEKEYSEVADRMSEEATTIQEIEEADNYLNNSRKQLENYANEIQEEARKYLQSKGYDSVFINNDVGTNGRKTKSYLVFDKSQLSEIQARASLPTQAEQVSKLSTVNENNLKQKQLDIIQKSNPMQDDYHTGIRTIDDIKAFKDTIDDNESFVWGDFSREDAVKALAKGEVKVYSSRPVENGNFVSTSYNQAKEYAGNGKIYSKMVPLTDVAWINGDEGQYAKIDNSLSLTKETEINQRLDKSKNELKNILAEVEKGNKTPEDIVNSDAIKQIEEIMKSIPETYTIDSEDRLKLREKIAQNMYDTITDGVSKEKNVDIIIGPPAAGKSTIANKYIAEHNAALLDSDMIKEQLPEFNGGIGANAVQEESSMMAEKIRQNLMSEGYNFVYPIVGKTLSSLEGKIKELKSIGYTVNLILNELPPEKTLIRALNRYVKTGRYLSPEYIKSVGLKPSENYDKIKLAGKIGGVDSYERYSNDVEYGEPAKRLESFREKRKTSREKSEVGHEIYSRDDRGDRATSQRESVLDVGKRIENSVADEQSAISLPENTYINPTEDLQKATEFVNNATEKDIKALEKMVEEAENHSERIGLQEFAQRAKRKLDKLKADSQRQIRYLREQVREGTADQEDITNVLRAEREVAKERVAEAKEQFKEQKAIEQERRNTSRAGNDLLKIVRRLDKLKTTPDNRAMIDELIGDIDKTSKGITEKGKINLEKLKAEYESMQENNPDFIPSKDIEKKISRLDRKHISDMSLDDIRDLTDVLRGVEHSIKTAKREIGVEHAREIYEIGEKAIEEIRNSKGDPAKNKVVDKLKGIYNTSTLSAKREFSKIGGWGNNEMAKQYQQLENGQTKQIDFQMRATKMFDDFNKQHKKEMEKWAGKKAEFIDTKILADGKRIKITPAMRMSLYLHSKNADNMRHIIGGGITIPNETLYKMGNYSESYARGNVARLTPTQIKDIINGMTASEKEFADIAYNFFNGMSKEAINETSLVLNGYELATVDNYFPITTNKNFTRSEFESLVRDGTIEGMGMLKERASASNPIILEDITGVLLRQIDNVGKYYGMAIPLRNFNAVYNTTTTGFGDSVKNAVSQKWGTNATNYIENLVTDLQGSKKQHDWFDTLKGNFAQATLAFNAGVTAKQVASYPTAASVLGWKALKKGITRAIKNRKMSHEEFNNLIDKYTPYYWYRRQGSIDTEIGDIVRDKSFVNKAPFLTNWIQSADMLTTGRLLWSASEEYVLENNPELKEGTDQFYKEVANVYNRTILDTQPNYTVLQRPDILRSDNKLLKSVTMFQTQRMQNYNIAYESIAEYKVALNKYNASKTKANEQNLKQAKKNLAKSISGLIVAGVSIATITALNNKLLNRGKDYQNEDGEETFGSITKGLAGDFMESMAGNVLWGSELYGFLTGNWYDLQAPQLDALNDIVNDISNFSTSISKAVEQKNTAYLYKSSNELAKTLATMFGIPLSNAEKYVGGILRKVLPEPMAQVDALYNYSSNKKYFEGKVKNGENLTSAKEVGISAYNYNKAYEAQKGIEGLKDKNGKTITNSQNIIKRKAIDDATPNLTQEQRKVLYENLLSSKTVIDMNDSDFKNSYQYVMKLASGAGNVNEDEVTKSNLTAQQKAYLIGINKTRK